MRIGFIKVSPIDRTRPALSGVTSAVRAWIGALGRRGHKSSVFAMQSYLKEEGGGKKYIRSMFGQRDLRSEIDSWIEENGIDLIHFNTTLGDTFRVLRRPFDCPVVQSIHTFEAVCPLRTKRLPGGALCKTPPGLVCVRSGCRSLGKFMLHDVFNRKISERYSSFLDGVIVHNRSLEGALAENNWPVPVYHVPLGVDRRRFGATESPGGNQVMFVGRLRPEKGVDVLLRAMEIVRRTIPEASLVLVGSGDSEDELRSLAVSLRLGEGVEFRGAVAPDDMPKQYSAADIVIVPSVWEENFGLVGIEAMASGRPVIGSDVSGIREWLNNGVEGTLVSPGNVHELAAAITAMLCDRDTRKAMGRAARERAIAFDVDETIEDLLHVYRAALSRGDASPIGSA